MLHSKAICKELIESSRETSKLEALMNSFFKSSMKFGNGFNDFINKSSFIFNEAIERLERQFILREPEGLPKKRGIYSEAFHRGLSVKSHGSDPGSSGKKMKEGITDQTLEAFISELNKRLKIGTKANWNAAGFKLKMELVKNLEILLDKVDPDTYSYNINPTNNENIVLRNKSSTMLNDRSTMYNPKNITDYNMRNALTKSLNINKYMPIYLDSRTNNIAQDQEEKDCLISNNGSKILRASYSSCCLKKKEVKAPREAKKSIASHDVESNRKKNHFIQSRYSKFRNTNQTFNPQNKSDTSRKEEQRCNNTQPIKSIIVEPVHCERFPFKHSDSAGIQLLNENKAQTNVFRNSAIRDIFKRNSKGSVQQESLRQTVFDMKSFKEVMKQLETTNESLAVAKTKAEDRKQYIKKMYDMMKLQEHRYSGELTIKQRKIDRLQDLCGKTFTALNYECGAVKNLEKRLKQLQMTVDEGLELMARTANKKLADYRLRMNSLNASISSQTKLIDTLKAEIAPEGTSPVSSDRDLISQFKKFISEYKNVKMSSLQRIDRLSAELNGLKDKHKLLLHQLEAKDQKVTELSEELANTLSKLSGSNVPKNGFAPSSNNNLKTLQLDESLESALSFLYSNFSDVVTLPLDVIEKIDILKPTDIDITESSLFKRIKERVENALGSILLTQKITALKNLNDLRLIRDAYDSLISVLQQYRLGERYMRIELSKFKSDNVKLKEAVRQSKEAYKSLESALSAHGTAIKDKDDVIAGYLSKLEKSKTEIETFRKDLKEKENVIAELKKATKRLISEADMVKHNELDQTAAHDSKISGLETKLLQKNTTIAAINIRLHENKKAYCAKLSTIMSRLDANINNIILEPNQTEPSQVKHKLLSVKSSMDEMQQAKEQVINLQEKIRSKVRGFCSFRFSDDQIRQLEVRLATLPTKLVKISDIINNSISRTANSEDMLKSTIAELSQLKAELENIKEEREDVEAELTSHKSLNSDITAENQFLMKRCELLDAKLKEFEDANNHLKTENSGSLSEILHTSVQNQIVFNSRIQELTAEITRLNALKEETESSLECLKDSIANMNERIFEYEINNNNLQQLAEELQSRNEKLGRSNDALTDRNEKLKIQADQAKAELKETQVKIKGITEETLRLKQANTDLQRNYEESKIESAKIQSELEIKVGSGAEKFKHLQKALIGLKRINQNIKNELKTFHQVFEECVNTRKELSELGVKTKQISELKTVQIEDLKAQISESIATSAKHQTLSDENINELTQAIKQNADLSSKISSYEKIHILIRLFIKTLKNTIEKNVDEFMNSHTCQVLTSIHNTKEEILKLLDIEIKTKECEKLFNNVFDLKLIYNYLKAAEAPNLKDEARPIKESFIYECITSIICEHKVEDEVKTVHQEAEISSKKIDDDNSLEQQVELLLEQNVVNEKTIDGLEQLLKKKERELIKALGRMKEMTQSNLESRLAQSMIELPKDSILLNQESCYTCNSVEDLAIFSNMADKIRELKTIFDADGIEHNKEKVTIMVDDLQEFGANVEKRFMREKNNQKELEKLISDLNTQIAESMNGMMNMNETMKMLKNDRDQFNIQMNLKQKSLERLRFTSDEINNVVRKEINDFRGRVQADKMATQLFTSFNTTNEHKINKGLGFAILANISLKRQFWALTRLVIQKEDNSKNNMERENSMLKDELLKLTKKLVDVETKRAELEEEYSKDFNTSNMLQSLDQAHAMGNSIPEYKPQIKPIIGKEGFSDPEVINRITYFVEMVTKYFNFTYRFTFKDLRQFNYVIKTLKNKMRDEKAHVEFLNDVKKDYKNLLDSKCKEYYDLHRKFKDITSDERPELYLIKEISLEDMIDRFYEHDDKPESPNRQTASKIDENDDEINKKDESSDKARNSIAYKREILRLNNENQVFRNQIEDYEENRKSILKQKEKLYEQYLAIKRENEEIKQQPKDESTQLLKEHIAATLFQFLSHFNRGNFKDAKLLLDIIATLLSLTDENSKLMVSYFSNLEPKKKTLTSYFK